MENKVIEVKEISTEIYGSLKLVYEGVDYSVNYIVKVLEPNTTIISTYLNKDVKTSLKNEIKAFLAEHLKQKYE